MSVCCCYTNVFWNTNYEFNWPSTRPAHMKDILITAHWPKIATYQAPRPISTTSTMFQPITITSFSWSWNLLSLGRPTQTQQSEVEEGLNIHIGRILVIGLSSMKPQLVRSRVKTGRGKKWSQFRKKKKKKKRKKKKKKTKKKKTINKEKKNRSL